MNYFTQFVVLWLCAQVINSNISRLYKCTKYKLTIYTVNKLICKCQLPCLLTPKSGIWVPGMIVEQEGLMVSISYVVLSVLCDVTH